MSPHDYALLAQEAYSAAPDIGKADSASRAIVRQTPGGLVVAFPGTDNAACLVSDFDIAPIEVPGIGRVYRGFWNAWDAISVPVLAAIAGRPVTLVGHSLGSSIALMAAAAMTAGGNPPVHVYGFEPPRVGVDLGVRTLLAKVPVFLFKNGNDLIVDLPPGGHHAALLKHGGVPLFPLPNLADHALTRVLLALAPTA